MLQLIRRRRGAARLQLAACLAVLIGALALMCCTGCGGIEAKEPPKPKPADFEPLPGDELHAGLTALLQTYVDEKTGMVDYEGLRTEGRQALDEYCDLLNFTDPKALSKDEQLAYWINAYNAFTLQLMLNNWERISVGIKDIPKAERWLAKIHACGGEYYSLDAIEHKILRVEFEEPRIHFAINCASLSCPLLRREAYVPSRLDEQLADATRKFLADEFRGVKFEGDSIKISMLFNPFWFKEDFVKKSGSITAFLKEHADEQTRAKLDALGDDIDDYGFLNYDWSLNGQAKKQG